MNSSENYEYLLGITMTWIREDLIRPTENPLVEEYKNLKLLLDCVAKANKPDSDVIRQTKVDEEEEKKHKCHYCPKRFKQSESLKKHIRAHTGEKPYQCSYCPKRFNVHSNRTVHMRRHTGDKRYQCGLCTKGFYTKSNLRVHLTKFHESKDKNDRTFVCLTCNKIFLSQIQLMRHMKTHKATETPAVSPSPSTPCPFKCDSCLKTFSSKAELDAHSESEHGEKRENKRPVKCRYCDKYYTNAEQLAIHTNLHLAAPVVMQDGKQMINFNKLLYQCIYCGKRFEENSRLLSHILYCPCKIYSEARKRPAENVTINKATDEVIDLTDDKEIEIVEPSNGVHTSALNSPYKDVDMENSKTESKEKEASSSIVDYDDLYDRATGKYKCTYCDKKFVYSGLTKHLRTHTGEKPYQCPFCYKLFNVQSNLTVHLRRHTGERPFQCGICDLKFTAKSSLDGHMRRRHEGKEEINEKVYKCTKCDQQFLEEFQLNLHTKWHDGEEKFRCDQCDLLFMSNETLMVHRKIHTGGKIWHQCENCSSKFDEKETLLNHMKCCNVSDDEADLGDMFVVEDEPYICDYCEQTFTQTSEFVKHMRCHVKE